MGLVVYDKAVGRRLNMEKAVSRFHVGETSLPRGEFESFIFWPKCIKLKYVFVSRRRRTTERERKLEVQVERGRGWQAASQEVEIAGGVEFRVAKQGEQGEHSEQGQTRRRSRSRDSWSPLLSQGIQRWCPQRSTGTTNSNCSEHVVQ
jgi:hypothetical protein